MKKILVFLFFVLVWIVVGVEASHASSNDSYYLSPYPNLFSQLIANLPQGSITITVGQETYYYGNGIFFQKVIREQKYIIVPPPIGAVVFSIPQDYQIMLMNGMSFYENHGIYYKRVIEGFKVIYPPK